LIEDDVTQITPVGFEIEFLIPSQEVIGISGDSRMQVQLPFFFGWKKV
jgi:hypothetical protein